MLTAILGILGSTGFGSLVGWIGGLLNRGLDLKAKLIDNAHQLAQRDKDIEQTKAEVAGQIAVADKAVEEARIVANGNIEVAGYNAMSESYDTQFSPEPDRFEWVNVVSKLVRPAVTVLFVLFSMTISCYIVYKAMNSGVVFTVAEWKEWVAYVVHWVFFQAGVVIGWWFANRPSGRPG